MKDRVDADEPAGPSAEIAQQSAEAPDKTADSSDKSALSDLQPARSEFFYQESDGTELDDIGASAPTAEKGGIIDDEDGKGLAEDALESMLPGPYDELPPPPRPSAPDPGTPLPNVDD